MTERGFRYVYSGQLTGTVNDVAAAQAYLAEDNMTRYLEDVAPSVLDIRWELDADGHNYRVIAISHRELTLKENEELTEWVRGQHSDGLGEGFEQQDFATDEEPEEPEYDEDDESTWCGDMDQFDMVSFDWKTNRSLFVKTPLFEKVGA